MLALVTRRVKRPASRSDLTDGEFWGEKMTTLGGRPEAVVASIATVRCVRYCDFVMIEKFED